MVVCVVERAVVWHKRKQGANFTHPHSIQILGRQLPQVVIAAIVAPVGVWERMGWGAVNSKLMRSTRAPTPNQQTGLHAQNCMTLANSSWSSTGLVWVFFGGSAVKLGATAIASAQQHNERVTGRNIKRPLHLHSLMSPVRKGHIGRRGSKVYLQSHGHGTGRMLPICRVLPTRPHPPPPLPGPKSPEP